jgi:hydrogenase expression/formation protein HypD
MVSSEGACAAYYKYGRLSTVGKQAKSISDKLKQNPICQVFVDKYL